MVSSMSWVKTTGAQTFLILPFPYIETVYHKTFDPTHTTMVYFSNADSSMHRLTLFLIPVI